jgi:hypothetical protein
MKGDPMSSSTTITAPISASRGFDLASAVTAIKKFLGGRSPMEMYPEEVEAALRYQVRLSRLRTPDPCEGEIGEVRPCFMLRQYSGKREIFWANTETQELVPLSFSASYKGRPERHPNLEIGSPR